MMNYELIFNGIKAAISCTIGFICLLIFTRIVRNKLQQSKGDHIGVLTSKLLFYIGIILLLLMVFGQLGFNVTALLGAAGITGAAIGLAAQSSVGNIISGLFLLIESSFKIGDTIHVGSVSGIIRSFNFLAIQLKTDSGEIMRVPYGMLLTSPVTIIAQQRKK